MDFVRELERARAIEPLLTANGIGVPDTTNTQDDLDAGFNSIRVDHVQKVYELVVQCQYRKTINTNHGSYGLKHIVERAIASYTTNGELIAAMLIAGFKHKPDGWLQHGRRLSPNASFNIAEKSVEWLELQNKHSGW